MQQPYLVIMVWVHFKILGNISCGSTASRYRAHNSVGTRRFATSTPHSIYVIQKSEMHPMVF
jgi:hypothetical protein